MVNVSLVITLVTLFCVASLLIVLMLGKRVRRKYTAILIHYSAKKSKKKQYGNGTVTSSSSSSSVKKKIQKSFPLPQVHVLWFCAVWLVFFVCFLISMYLYFDGNCIFNSPFNLSEGSDVDNQAWIRGIITLVFLMVSLFVGGAWFYVFFIRRRFRIAFFLVFLEVALHVVILWAMPSTHQCVGDDVTNRYWISFGLYIVYSIWWLIALYINWCWWGVLGYKLVKAKDKGSHYAIDSRYSSLKEEKVREKYEKKMDRYGIDGYNAYYAPINARNSDVELNTFPQQQQQQLHNMIGGSTSWNLTAFT